MFCFYTFFVMYRRSFCVSFITACYGFGYVKHRYCVKPFGRTHRILSNGRIDVCFFFFFFLQFSFHFLYSFHIFYAARIKQDFFLMGNHKYRPGFLFCFQRFDRLYERIYEEETKLEMHIVRLMSRPKPNARYAFAEC